MDAARFRCGLASVLPLVVALVVISPPAPVPGGCAGPAPDRERRPPRRPTKRVRVHEVGRAYRRHRDGGQRSPASPRQVDHSRRRAGGAL